MLLTCPGMRAGVITAILVLATLASVTTFLAAAQHHGAPPRGNYVPQTSADWHLSGPDARQRREAMLRRAEWRLSSTDRASFTASAPLLRERALRDVRSCRFVNEAPSGTTAKFNCVLDGGMVVKVKYGRNPEIQGEVAGTRLLRALGFPADEVDIVPRLRCYGCPRDPYMTIVAANWTSTRELLGPGGFANGYTDFDWVAIERRFPAPPIETDDAEGWAWWEVQNNTAYRDDLDALRLTAVFLAHWDNKRENQRLVCLDGTPPTPVPDCVRPLAMIQDLGATFGPTKVNIGSWGALPVWQDRSACRVSMHALPWRGGTFPNAQISEAARQQVGDGLTALTDEQLRDFFRGARFPEFQTATDDERDLQQWVAVFKDRVRQIADAGPCPTRIDD